MTKKEYNAYKMHILEYMDAGDIAENIKHYKAIYGAAMTTYKAALNMVQDGFFACYYGQVLDALEEVYKEDYRPETYETKAGGLRYRGGECYAWTVYKHKIAKTIETMEKKGEL